MNKYLGLILFLCLFQVVKAQNNKITLSGQIKSEVSKLGLPYVNIKLTDEKSKTFINGTISTEDGHFVLTEVTPGNYDIAISYLGYKSFSQNLVVGSLSPFLNLGEIVLSEDPNDLKEVTITGQLADGVSNQLDKKVFSIAENVSQSGGSILNAMKNLPGITVDQDGKLLLRGSDKVAILIDGKQTAITGFGNQTGLDNLPASAIERIEIINNPSAKYDANGNAGIINIIYKKNRADGFNGKIGLTTGLGALWVKKQNLPQIRPQFQNTFKLNPSLSLNYRKNKLNWFFQGDYLHTPTLNKNEFVVRTYDDGTIINQQTKRNRNTNITTLKTGVDLHITDHDILSISGLFSSEKIIDNGDEPFFNKNFTVRNRLWQFLEDELKTTVTASVNYRHQYLQPGRTLNFGLNYTFHREDEKYFFTNIMPDFTGKDAFKLLSDENVFDFNADYVQPLRYGRIETGLKLRRRFIPTNMLFYPGLNSPLDSLAGGWANYKETIPAVYGNYVFENKNFEIEAGLRFEYVKLNYAVNPSHPTYKSSGYSYGQPFPNLRIAYKINKNNKLSLFYNRRVDRPSEVDIRIFPKYDDAEIIKIGNPALSPQFTSSVEAGYKMDWKNGYLFAALYHKATNHTITRIGTIVPGETIIYTIFQNAGNSYSAGVEFLAQQKITDWFSLNMSFNVYNNTINAFTVESKYPVLSTFSAEKQTIWSGNGKLIGNIKLKKDFDIQISGVYLAPDLIPQGKTGERYAVDLGIKKQLPKGELFFNASDLFNTMVIKKSIIGNGFSYQSKDYYETQVIRIGYSRKF